MSQGEAVDPIEIVRDVHRRLRACGTAERREIAKGYFPTAMTVFGATVPDLRAVVRDFAKQLTTFRASGPSLRARLRGVSVFSLVFLQQLKQVYLRRRGRAKDSAPS